MTDIIFKPGEYVTRDGRKARVYATDGVGDQPLHGAIESDEGWSLNKWKRNGKWFGSDCSADLMPPKQVRYVNVYSNSPISTGVYYDRASADFGASNINRIACIRIEFTEGQYDD